MTERHCICVVTMVTRAVTMATTATVYTGCAVGRVAVQWCGEKVCCEVCHGGVLVGPDIDLRPLH